MTTTLDRGTTTITERLVERLTAHAVTEVDGVSGTTRRVLGVAVGTDESIQVTARITGTHTALSVHLAVDYPRSVTTTTAQARTHLMARVEELTGLTVSKVDITVTSLPTTTTPSRRVQ